MTDRLHLSPDHRRILEAFLREQVRDADVWAYAGGVNGRGHEGSRFWAGGDAQIDVPVGADAPADFGRVAVPFRSSRQSH